MTSDDVRHIAASMEMIGEAAHLSGGGIATLLGCGRCGEIPLHELAKTFRSIDLVDNDRAALDAIEERCRSWQETTWHIHEADLTGLIAPLRREARQIAAAAADVRSCLDRFCELLDMAAPELWTAPGGERFELVVCSAVLTRLQAGVRRALQEEMSAAFPDDVAPMISSERWRQTVWRFARDLEERLVRHLRWLCCERGVVYLSDTVYVCWVEETEPGRFRTEGAWIATRTARLNDYLLAADEVLRERQWQWMRWERDGRYAGRLYGVQAITYRPASEEYP
jgi:hypothetical protein